ncbi:hypothetical protein ABKN59_005142 [Abortiporus biennis]
MPIPTARNLLYEISKTDRFLDGMCRVLTTRIPSTDTFDFSISNAIWSLAKMFAIAIDHLKVNRINIGLHECAILIQSQEVLENPKRIKLGHCLSGMEWARCAEGLNLVGPLDGLDDIEKPCLRETLLTGR